MSHTTVATWGTFDGDIHPGHIHFLQTCRQYGEVTVFLLDDAGIERQKHRRPVYDQKERKKHLLATGLVAKVIEGGADQEVNAKATLAYSPDYYCFGGDQTSPWNKDLERRLAALGTKIVHIPRYRPDRFSTTLLHFDPAHDPNTKSPPK